MGSTTNLILHRQKSHYGNLTKTLFSTSVFVYGTWKIHSH